MWPFQEPNEFSSLKNCISQARLFGLPEIYCKGAMEDLAQREYVVAFNFLCDQLYEHNIRITLDYYKELMSTREELGSEIRDWSILIELTKASDVDDSQA